MYVQIFLVRFAAISTQFESTVVTEAEISQWFGFHKSVAFVWLLLDETMEMLCFSLSVLTTVATGD